MLSSTQALLRTRKSFSREAYEGRVRKLARAIATRFSRGNVAAQNGYLLTPEELERRRNNLRQKLEREESV